jgi:hypothetical protein
MWHFPAVDPATAKQVAGQCVSILPALRSGDGCEIILHRTIGAECIQLQALEFFRPI